MFCFVFVCSVDGVGRMCIISSVSYIVEAVEEAIPAAAAAVEKTVAVAV